MEDDVPDGGGAAAPPVPLLSLGLFLCLLVFAAAVALGGWVQVRNVPVGAWFTPLFIFMGLPFAMLRAVGLEPRAFTGLSPVRWGALAAGAGLGVVNYAAWAVPLMVASEALLPDGLAEQFDSSRVFDHQSAVEQLLTLAAVVLAAPLCEEFFFRGILLKGLASRLEPKVAIVASAAIFSAFHVDPVGFLARLELGILFGALALRTGSLWPSIGAHAANNAVAAVLFFVTRTIADEEVPWWLAGLLMLVGNLGLLVAARWLWRRWPAPRPGGGVDLAPPVPFFLSLAPWAAAASVAVALMLSLDGRGIALRAFEQAHPLPRALATDPRLEQLRARARAGEIPLEEYYEARSLMREDPPPR